MIICHLRSLFLIHNNIVFEIENNFSFITDDTHNYYCTFYLGTSRTLQNYFFNKYNKMKVIYKIQTRWNEIQVAHRKVLYYNLILKNKIYKLTL